MVPTERSYHREIHVKYQSSSIHCLKVISKFKVLKKIQGQGHRVKNNGTQVIIHVKYQSSRTHCSKVNMFYGATVGASAANTCSNLINFYPCLE